MMMLKVIKSIPHEQPLKKGSVYFNLGIQFIDSQDLLILLELLSHFTLKVSFHKVEL